MSMSHLNFGALMLPALGDVVPGSTVLTFLGKPQPTPNTPSLRARLCAAARREEAAGSTSGRNCTEIPSASLAWEPASTAANPNGLQEPPLPSSCTGYLLLNQGLGIFSQIKVCLNSHTHKAGEGRPVCLQTEVCELLVSFFPAIYNLGKNGILIDLFSTYLKLAKI